MVELYEYFFYRVYWLDVEKTKLFTPKEGAVSASIVMTGVMGYNYIFIAELIIRFLYPEDYLFRDYPHWEPFVIILALNCYYFTRKGRWEDIVNYWKNMATQDERLSMDRKLILYIVITHVLVFLIAER